MTDLKEKLDKLMRKAPEGCTKKHVAGTNQSPQELFIQAVQDYAKAKTFAHQSWATGLISYATYAKSWGELVQMVQRNVVQQEYAGIHTIFPQFEQHLPHFGGYMSNFVQAMDPNDLSFLELFALAVRGEGDPDKILESYFGGKK